MTPIALTLHLLSAPSVANPLAGVKLAPPLQLQLLSGADPMPSQTTLAPPARSSGPRLMETLVGTATFFGGSLAEGALDLVLLAIVLNGGGGLVDGNSGNPGLLSGGLIGVVVIGLIAWLGIPVLEAFAEHSVATMGGDSSSNLFMGAVGAWIGESIGDAGAVGAFLLANAAGSNVFSFLPLSLFVIVALPAVFSALGASFGLHAGIAGNPWADKASAPAAPAEMSPSTAPLNTLPSPNAPDAAPPMPSTAIFMLPVFSFG